MRITDVGDDAVGAEVVAAVHDGHPRLEGALADHRDALGHGPGYVVGGVDPLAGGELLQQQLGKLPQQLGAEDQVHMGEGLPQPLGHMVLPGHAAAQADELVRVAALGVQQGPHVAKDPVLGVLPDGAGVHEHQVGPLLAVGEGIAHPGQIAPQALGVCLVLLAAVGVYKGGLLSGPPVQQGADLVAKGELAGDLRRVNGQGLSQSGSLRVRDGRRTAAGR